MNFSKRYFLWLLLPPPLLSIPLSVIFLSQRLRLTTGEWLGLISLLLVSGMIGLLIFAQRTRAGVEAFESAGTRAEQSEIASHLLRRTLEGATVGWGVGSAIFAVAATIIYFPNWIGFSWFLVAILGSALPSIAWAYGAGKRLLQRSAPPGEMHYVGRRFGVGSKIAAVFISFFIFSSAAVILLVASRVSSALEEMAVQGLAAEFTSVQAIASAQEMSEASLEDLRRYLSDAYVLYRIAPDGTVSAAAAASQTASPLDARELAEMRRLQNGTSLSFDSTHVGRFATLDDGSILFVSVPWESYAGIPMEVAFYAVVVSLLTLGVFILAAYFLSKDIAGPLRRLSKAAASMAEGDFRTRPWVFTDDEIGLVGEQFESTRQNLVGLIGKLGSSGRSIAEGARVITGGASQLVIRSSQQSELTEGSSTSLGNVRLGSEAILRSAEGVAEQTSDASSRSLELQASSEEVARSMDYLFQSVEKTSASTTEMDAAAREMSGRTSFLADIGEEVLSFVTEMDSTIAELRQRAQATADFSRKVREQAEAGGTAVGETVVGIQQSQQSSRRAADVLDDLQKRIGQISQILNVIEDITERTNLLSLNAAIIAAQAGEQGAGFSVVAGEIRELADRTRGQTKEIGGIIKAVQNGSKEAVRAMQAGLEIVDRNVNLAQNAAGSLEQILDSAGQSYDMANRISSSLEEQASATRHLHEVTSRMSDHIAEINRSTQEQARGTRLLAEEAERVREIALQVRNSTDEQSVAGKGISTAMEQIAADVRHIRDLLQGQLAEMQKIAEASQDMLGIAQRNQALAGDFTGSVHSLVRSGQDFEAEVARFRLKDEA